jgi:hypothetical protein
MFGEAADAMELERTSGGGQETECDFDSLPVETLPAEEGPNWPPPSSQRSNIEISAARTVPPGVAPPTNPFHGEL